MKKFIKIIVPILLSVAIIASIGWYLFQYDKNFTTEQLVRIARRFEADGNPSMAIRLYNMAYDHSDGDPEVALELAELFRGSGNYTKAEYTLSKAIADGGGLELYTALCRLFVEQDKLLDAVKMLDNVSDSAIRMQLESMRPAAPVATPEPDHYSDYISVSFENAEGAVFADFNGGYPSISDGAFTGEHSLQAGETTIRAVVLGQNGLVSPMVSFDYVVANVIEPVTLSDEAIDRVVRETLQLSADHKLYSDELWKIVNLEIPSDAQSLADLSKMPFLEEISIYEGSVTDLSPLASLSNLTRLSIIDTPVSSSDLAYLAELPKLTELTLSGCGLSSIADLAPAAGLTDLDLSFNTIGNLLPLADMKKLEAVDVSHNAVTSLSVFSRLPALTELRASYNSITSLEDLSGCGALATLEVTGNQLTSLSGIQSLPTLRAFYGAFNQITDITGLESCTLIGELDISNNQITDITGLSTLTQLLNFNFSFNQVTLLPEFSKDCPLVSIKGSSNQLESLEALRGLNDLNFVYMDQNATLTSVEPLVDCYRLVEVHIYGTGITDVSLLTQPIDGKDRDITVFYSPIPVA